MSGIITAEIPGHGTFRVHAKDLDAAISQMLPASPMVLRSLWEEWMGETMPKENTPTVSELLIMLTTIVHGNVEVDPETPTPYTELSRITTLVYGYLSHTEFALTSYAFISGEGFNKDGRRVTIKPPDVCQVIPGDRPASYLLMHWPDIREQVPEFFVRNALVLEGPP